MATFPSASSSDLFLTNPTPLEVIRTHHLSSPEWAGPLSTPQYIENEHRLAIHLGITHWILTSKAGVLDKRPILASCETIQKRCLVKSKKFDAEIRDRVVIGVAAVFCESAYRGKGYAGRMMRELAETLRSDGEGKYVGSVLWSDIGSKYYSGLGWKPCASMHVEMPASRPLPGSTLLIARPILREDLAELCERDEELLRATMAKSMNTETLFAIVPAHETTSWLHKKEEYICEEMFGKSPDVKGALAGEVGERIWVYWTRAFYNSLADPRDWNRLYISRLVVESPDAEHQVGFVEKVKAVLEAAMHEASAWKLPMVEMYNPDATMRGWIEKAGIDHRIVDREKWAIPSLMWFDNANEENEAVRWIVNEQYAWC